MDDGAPIPPGTDNDSEAFWSGCTDGVLRVQRCAACTTFAFPPSPVCTVCHARSFVLVDLVAPRGVVYSFTVSGSSLRPSLAAPYALALVDLIDAPGVRLTLRVVGATDIDIGDEVEVDLEPHSGFAVPVARRTGPPSPDHPEPHHADLGQLAFEVVLPIDRPEDRAVLTGVGRSAVGRKLMRSDLDLTVEAALAAVADAGLVVGDIDGIATYPGFGVGPPGYSGPHTDDVARALGLQLAWHRAGAEGAGQLQPVIDAVQAVAAGLCTNALVFRTSTETTAAARMKAGRLAPPSMAAASGFTQWLVPFDAVSPAHWFAPYQTRHMHRFGTTREQVASVAVVAREHAARTPGAVFTEPLSLDDYLGARMISWPIGLLDCDVPVDGSVAVVVSRADRAAAAPEGNVVRIEAMGTGVGFPPAWHQWPDLTTMAAHGAAASMWARTSLGPTDVDTAQVYDGFAFLALYWLEALGFCGHGEAGAFVEGGGRIRLGGQLPMNTQGGQLSGGRLHGWGFLEEAIHQLRGTATGRQVPGAEVAVVSTGGGPIAGCLLLSR